MKRIWVVKKSQDYTLRNRSMFSTIFWTSIPCRRWTYLYLCPTKRSRGFKQSTTLKINLWNFIFIDFIWIFWCRRYEHISQASSRGVGGVSDTLLLELEPCACWALYQNPLNTKITWSKKTLYIQIRRC